MNYRDNDDGLFTDSDLNKSMSNVKKKMDSHLSQLGQLLNVPISSFQ